MIRVFESEAQWRTHARPAVAGTSVREATAAIIDEVRRDGDRALIRLARRFDKVDLTEMRVPAAEVEALAGKLSASDRAVLQRTYDRIVAFHRLQREESFRMLDARGAARLEWRVTPVAAVGVYVPGGAAVYPSTVLMNVAPARVAGVSCIALATPPGALEKHPALAAAICLTRVTEVYRVGGAQAIAAFALGTASIPRVDLVVGPGNAFVAEAKRQLSDVVGIDSIAGPSEVVIMADDSAPAAWVAADLLAQAEHGSGEELAVLLTSSPELAAAVVAEVERQVPGQPNADAIAEALAARGAVIMVGNLFEAVWVANRIAPEHVQIMTRNPEELVPHLWGAGSVLVGSHAPVAIGDYGIGPNHVLPTGGTARFASPLSVADFCRRQSVIRADRPALGAVRDDCIRLARMEGFEAHARSIEIRFDAAGASR